MQPYPNPNYYAQYQQPQFTNPYMQRMENLQQFQQAIQQPQIAMAPMGKVVESMDIVKVTDIPMDGNTYYFPKADGTEVYSKQFLPNGQTRILTFKPLFENDADNSSSEKEQSQITLINDVLEGIKSDIKALTDKVDKISTSQKPKKAVTEDE